MCDFFFFIDLKLFDGKRKLIRREKIWYLVKVKKDRDEAKVGIKLLFFITFAATKSREGYVSMRVYLYVCLCVCVCVCLFLK